MLPQTATAALFSLLSFLVLEASARAPTVLTVTADGRDTSKWVEYRLPEIGNGVAHELKFEFKENHFNLLEWTNFDTKETKKGPFLAGDGHFTAKTFGPKGTPNVRLPPVYACTVPRADGQVSLREAGCGAR